MVYSLGEERRMQFSLYQKYKELKPHFHPPVITLAVTMQCSHYHKYKELKSFSLPPVVTLASSIHYPTLENLLSWPCKEK